MQLDHAADTQRTAENFMGALWRHEYNNFVNVSSSLRDQDAAVDEDIEFDET